MKQIFVMAGSFLSRWFALLVKNEKRVPILSRVVLPAFFFHEIGRGMISPLKRAYMNKRIPCKQRATIISFDSMITYAGAFVGLVVGGGLAESYSINVAWAASGIVLAIAVSVFLALQNGNG